MDRIVGLAKNVLLAFVLGTIGFAVGKEVTLRSVRGGTGAEPAAAAGLKAEREDRVIVYYLHATFRCVTCNTIEKMTRNVLQTGFSDALADGRIEWRVADFQQDEALGKRYEIVSSGVLVVHIRNGKETGFRRLDDVWTLLSDAAAFDKYVGDAIREALPAASTEGTRS